MCIAAQFYHVDILLFPVSCVHIVDTFQLKGEDDTPDMTVLASCMFDTGHTLTVCVVLSVFLVCQCVLLMLCVRVGVARTRGGGDTQMEHPYFHTAVFGYQVNTSSVDKVNTLH